jgi:hypothetical protein
VLTVDEVTVDVASVDETTSMPSLREPNKLSII